MAPFHMPRFRSQSGPEVGAQPRIDDVRPAAALPLGQVELTGANLGPVNYAAPAVIAGGLAAHLLMSRPTRLAFQVPGLATNGTVEVRTPAGSSNAAPLKVAREL